MRPVTLPQAELALQVLLQQRLLFNRLQKSLINLLLVITPVAAGRFLLRTLTLLKERLLTPCLLYTSPSPRDGLLSRMPSSA